MNGNVIRNKCSILVLSLLCFWLASSCTTTQSPKNPYLNCNESDAINYNPDAPSDSACFYLDNRKRPLFTYFSSTHCVVCGRKGNPLFEVLIEKYPLLSPYAVHYGFGDELQIEVNKELFDFYDPDFSPYYFFDKDDVMARNSKTGIDFKTTRENLKSLYEEHKNENARVSLSGMHYIQNDTINFRVKLNKINPEKTLSLAVYLLEDKVLEEQNGYNEEIEHHNVLRKVYTKVFGDKIISKGNKPLKLEFTGNIESDWDESNLKSLFIVFNNEDGKREVINSFLFPDHVVVSTTN